MLRHTTLLILLLLRLLPVQAQPTAQFETTFYFEDAIGNRDSVIVGYDTLATHDIDPEFGEMEILAPFDSVFEVRAGHFDWPWREKLSKKIIDRGSIAVGPNPPEDCYSGGRIFIFVWATHQPVKVWWDRPTFLNSRCYRASALLNHWVDELAGPIAPENIPPEYACLAAEDSIFFDISEEYLTADSSMARISLEKEVQGLGEQSIYGLRFFPASTPYDYSPCFWVTSTREADEPPGLLIYPNPTSGEANIQLPEGVEVLLIELYGANGALLRQQRNVQPAQFNLSGLPSGIYQLLVMGSDGKRYWERVVKQ
ncbi:MAG: T9SS type A sorting domain-containing protein [Phaeodactylibacter sp.]|nr:T9SS type A sorting domain-containing protein [Phaeodactylibacter sp.]